MSSILRTAFLVMLFPAAAHAASLQINLNHECANGGSRVTTGTWDPITGATNLTVALNACNMDDHEVHTGTVTLTGTVVATDATDSAISENVTYTINTTIAGENNFTRVCTITSVGTYTVASKAFSGTVTRNNCSLQGSFVQRGGNLAGLLKAATTAEQ